MPVIVPVPGNFWPSANVICPLLAMFNPVSMGEPLPLSYRRFKVPAGLAVLFPTGSVCHWNLGAIACPVALLKDEPSIDNGCELKPFEAVAVPVGGRRKFPRAVRLPLISSNALGVLVPIPILLAPD